MGAAHHMRFPSDFCTFVLQPYSSWSCSPAELHYASDCGAKVQNWLESGKCKEGKNTLQFELLTTYLSKIPCKMSYTPDFEQRIKRFHGFHGFHGFCLPPIRFLWRMFGRSRFSQLYGTRNSNLTARKIIWEKLSFFGNLFVYLQRLFKVERL